MFRVDLATCELVEITRSIGSEIKSNSNHGIKDMPLNSSSRHKGSFWVHSQCKKIRDVLKTSKITLVGMNLEKGSLLF
jgi:hypothetical protein